MTDELTRLRAEVESLKKRVHELEFEPNGQLRAILSNEALADILANTHKLQAENESLRKQIAEQGWQPIETAPKDGRKVLAAFKGQFAWMMFVAIAGPFGVSEPGYAAPTHWRPLPEPPIDRAMEKAK